MKTAQSWPKGFFFSLLALSIAFVSFSPLSARPKSNFSKKGLETAKLKTQDPIQTNPVVYDDDSWLSEKSGVFFPTSPYHYLGPSRLEQAAVPYLNIRVGTSELPGSNNHMRRQVALSSTGTVHMVYYVVNYTGGRITAADSAINFRYFYNAYDCSNSNALLFNDGFGLPVAVTPPDNPGANMTQLGGLFIPPNTAAPVVYGRRLIRREDTPPAGDFTARGSATYRDGGECLGSFSLDTTMSALTTRLHPVAYPVNESVWVATYRAGSSPTLVAFNHTTDRGQTWSSDQILTINSPWYNSTEITGTGNTFYIVSIGDPADPAPCFYGCGRPLYLKGIYDPATGAIVFGTVVDLAGDFEWPKYKANFLGLSALMIGDTLHVVWTDWNNWDGNGFPGPGGHVHHAAVEPDGTVRGPHKIADINVDGRLPGRSFTQLGVGEGVWPYVSLSYNPTAEYLYALWSQPPDEGAFGWADYEQYGALAVYDIFSSASSNNGRSWDEPQNVTQTNNPGCSGAIGDECHHEDYFVAAERADSVINVLAAVQRYPGIQESALRSGINPDPGPWTEHRDVVRLYRVPARTPVASIRAVLEVHPADTSRLDAISLQPQIGFTSVPMQVANLGVTGFSLDSAKLIGTLNDGFLATSVDAVPGTLIPPGETYDFNLIFNASGVSPSNQGLRSGYLAAYVSTADPAVPPEKRKKTMIASIKAYVVINLCLNRKVQIHSASNVTDVGIQGSIKDRSGFGMHYAVTGYDNFYDGGMWIANSSLNGQSCTGPRKVSHLSEAGRFLQCLTDGVLDSTIGSDPSYYNLFLKSIGTDIDDSGLVWQNIWEQSTHPDSSDFLIQTTRVINIGDAPIDSVALGVWYDIDVTVSGMVSAYANVGGDTTVNHLDRTWWLGWIADNDVSIDSCSPGPFAYGFVVVPGSIGNPGETVRPRGAVVYEQSLFWDPCLFYSDSLNQRYSYYLNVLASTRDRNHDTLTGVWEDTLGAGENDAFICGDNDTGPPWRADMAYLAIAKKVYNLPVNGGGQNVVGRFGLEGLAASIDTFFSGPGETYTVIHVASNGNGISELMANAVIAIDWYVNHAGTHVGPRQTRLKGDLNNDGGLSATDVAVQLNYIFLGVYAYGGFAISTCVADLDNNGYVSATDAVLLINKIFLNIGCPNCLRPCI